MGKSVTESDAGSFVSSLSHNSAITKLRKYELKRKFYEKLEDFKHRVLLYREPGFVVYRAKCSYSGAVVVLKGYSRDALTHQTRQRIWSEVNILQGAQCPFILKCFDSFEDQGWWFLVLENCAAGDLYRIVQSEGRITNEGWLVSQVLLPLIQTLAYLHAEGIIHRDIKPEHVLFNSEKVVKLSGFFLAQDVTKFGAPRDMVGTLDYVAPEVFRLSTPDAQQLARQGAVAGCYDAKVDIWDVGVLTYDVLVGVPPFAAEEPNLTVQRVLTDDPVFPDELSDLACDFILCCLTKDPVERPTARQLLAHPWVREYMSWVPSPDFEDPVPDLDWEYYEPDKRLLGDDLDDQDDDKSSEEGEPRVWYNPATWFRRNDKQRDLEQDLSGVDDNANANGQGAGKPGGGRSTSVTATDGEGVLGAAQRFLSNLKPGGAHQGLPQTAHDHDGAHDGALPPRASERVPGKAGSMRSGRVAPSTPPLKGALSAHGDDGDDVDFIGVGTPLGHQGGSALGVGMDGGPVDGTPRSDRISDDGEAAAPVMQRIFEAKNSTAALPSHRAGNAPVPPVSAADDPLMQRTAPGASSSSPRPPGTARAGAIVAPPPPPFPQQAGGSGSHGRGVGMALPAPGTPTAQSDEMVVYSSSQAPSARSDHEHTSGGGGAGGSRGQQPVPPLALSRLQHSASNRQPAPPPGGGPPGSGRQAPLPPGTDDVLKLSARGPLYSGRPAPDDLTTLPSPPPAAAPSLRSHLSGAGAGALAPPPLSDRSTRDLEALAPPGASASTTARDRHQLPGQGIGSSKALQPVPPPPKPAAAALPTGAGASSSSPRPPGSARAPAAVPAGEPTIGPQ